MKRVRPGAGGEYYGSSVASAESSDASSSSDEEDMTFEQKLTAKKNGRSRDPRAIVSRGRDGRMERGQSEKTEGAGKPKKKKSKNVNLKKKK